MEKSKFTRYSCRLCLTESDFNVSLFGNYARKTHIVEKILACLKVVIEDTDPLTTVCYKCAGNVERYYDFVTVIKKSQNRLNYSNERNVGLLDESFSRRRITYVIEEVEGAGDYTFSFLETPQEKSSNTLFSVLSPPKQLVKAETDVWKMPREVGQNKKYSEHEDKSREMGRQREKSSTRLFTNLPPQKSLVKEETDVWKTPREVSQNKKFQREDKANEKVRQREMSSKPLFTPQKPVKDIDVWKTPRDVDRNKKNEREDKSSVKNRWQKNCSRDSFETQSQEEEQPNGSDWKLTPEDNIIEKARALFGWP